MVLTPEWVHHHSFSKRLCCSRDPQGGSCSGLCSAAGDAEASERSLPMDSTNLIVKSKVFTFFFFFYFIFSLFFKSSFNFF